MIDTQDLRLIEYLEQYLVQCTRALEVTAEWLLDDDTRAARATGPAEPLRNSREHFWRDSQLIERVLRVTERAPQRVVRC